MNIRVLALSLLLFWGIVAPAFANDETTAGDKTIHVKQDGENKDAIVPFLQRGTTRPSNDGGGKNIGVIVDDLTPHNVQPAQEASSGTDWGGLNSNSKREKESGRRQKREDAEFNLFSIIKNGFGFGKRMLDSAVESIQTFVRSIGGKKAEESSHEIMKHWDDLTRKVGKVVLIIAGQPNPTDQNGLKANNESVVKTENDTNVEGVKVETPEQQEAPNSEDEKAEPSTVDSQPPLPRQKRSISGNTNAMQKVIKSGQATVAETLNGGAAIQRILVQAEAEANRAKAELYKRKFRSKLFKNDFDDWMLLRSRSDILGNIFNIPHRSRLRPHVRPPNNHSYERSKVDSLRKVNNDFGRHDEASTGVDQTQDFESMNVGHQGYRGWNRNHGGHNFIRQGRPHSRQWHRPNVHDYRNHIRQRAKYRPVLTQGPVDSGEYNTAHLNKNYAEVNRMQNKHSFSKEATKSEAQHDLMVENTNVRNTKIMASSDSKNVVGDRWSSNEKQTIDTVSSNINNGIAVENTGFANWVNEDPRRINMPSWVRGGSKSVDNTQRQTWNAVYPHTRDIADNGKAAEQRRWAPFGNGGKWNERGRAVEKTLWEKGSGTILATDKENDNAEATWRLRESEVEHRKTRRIGKTNSEDVVSVGTGGEGYASKSLENPSASAQAVVDTNTNVEIGKHAAAPEISSHAQSAANKYNVAAEHIGYARANYHEHGGATSTSAVNGRVTDDAQQSDAEETVSGMEMSRQSIIKSRNQANIARTGNSAIYQNYDNVISDSSNRNKKGRYRDMINEHLSNGGIVPHAHRRKFNTKFKHLFSNGELTANDDEGSSSKEGGFFNFFVEDPNRPRKHYRVRTRRPPDSTEKDIQFNWSAEESESEELINYTDIHPEDEDNDAMFVVSPPGMKLRNRDKVSKYGRLPRGRQAQNANDLNVGRSNSQVESAPLPDDPLDNKHRVDGRVASRRRGNNQLTDDASADWKVSDTSDSDIVTRRRTGDTSGGRFQKNHLGRDITVDNTGRRHTSQVLDVSNADVASTTAIVDSLERGKLETFRTDNAQGIHVPEELADVDIIGNARDSVNNDEMYYSKESDRRRFGRPFRKHHRMSELSDNQWKEMSIEEDIETGASNIDAIQTTLVLDDPSEATAITSSERKQHLTKASLESQSNESQENAVEEAVASTLSHTAAASSLEKQSDFQVNSKAFAVGERMRSGHTHSSAGMSKEQAALRRTHTAAKKNVDYVHSDVEEEIDETLLSAQSSAADVASAVEGITHSSINEDARTLAAAERTSKEMAIRGKGSLDNTREVLDNGSIGLAVSRSPQSSVLTGAHDENTSQVEEAVKTITASGTESSEGGSLDTSIVHEHIGRRAKMSHRRKQSKYIDDGIYRKDTEEMSDKSVGRVSVAATQSSSESQESRESSSVSVITKATALLKDNEAQNEISQERQEAASAKILSIESNASANSNAQVEKGTPLPDDISLASSSTEIYDTGLDPYYATNTRGLPFSREHFKTENQHGYGHKTSPYDEPSESSGFTTASIAAAESDTRGDQERISVSGSFIGAADMEMEKGVLSTHRDDESVNEISAIASASAEETSGVDGTIDSISSTSSYDTAKRSNENNWMLGEKAENEKIHIQRGKSFIDSIKESHTKDGFNSGVRESQELSAGVESSAAVTTKSGGEVAEHVVRSIGTGAAVSAISPEESVVNVPADSLERSTEHHAKRKKISAREKNSIGMTSKEIAEQMQKDARNIASSFALSHSNEERSYGKSTSRTRTGEKPIGKTIEASASNEKNNSRRRTEALASTVAEALVDLMMHGRGWHERSKNRLEKSDINSVNRMAVTMEENSDNSTNSLNIDSVDHYIDASAKGTASASAVDLYEKYTAGKNIRADRINKEHKQLRRGSSEEAASLEEISLEEKSVLGTHAPAVSHAKKTASAEVEAAARAEAMSTMRTIRTDIDPGENIITNNAMYDKSASYGHVDPGIHIGTLHSAARRKRKRLRGKHRHRGFARKELNNERDALIETLAKSAESNERNVEDSSTMGSTYHGESMESSWDSINEKRDASSLAVSAGISTVLAGNMGNAGISEHQRLETGESRVESAASSERHREDTLAFGKELSNEVSLLKKERHFRIEDDPEALLATDMDSIHAVDTIDNSSKEPDFGSGLITIGGVVHSAARAQKAKDISAVVHKWRPLSSQNLAEETSDERDTVEELAADPTRTKENINKVNRGSSSTHFRPRLSRLPTLVSVEKNASAERLASANVRSTTSTTEEVSTDATIANAGAADAHSAAANEIYEGSGASELHSQVSHKESQEEDTEIETLTSSSVGAEVSSAEATTIALSVDPSREFSQDIDIATELINTVAKSRASADADAQIDSGISSVALGSTQVSREENQHYGNAEEQSAQASVISSIGAATAVHSAKTSREIDENVAIRSKLRNTQKKSYAYGSAGAQTDSTISSLALGSTQVSGEELQYGSAERQSTETSAMSSIATTTAVHSSESSREIKDNVAITNKLRNAKKTSYASASAEVQTDNAMSSSALGSTQVSQEELQQHVSTDEQSAAAFAPTSVEVVTSPQSAEVTEMSDELDSGSKLTTTGIHNGLYKGASLETQHESDVSMSAYEESQRISKEELLHAGSNTEAQNLAFSSIEAEGLQVAGLKDEVETEAVVMDKSEAFAHRLETLRALKSKEQTHEATRDFISEEHTTNVGMSSLSSAQAGISAASLSSKIGLVSQKLDRGNRANSLPSDLSSTVSAETHRDASTSEMSHETSYEKQDHYVNHQHNRQPKASDAASTSAKRYVASSAGLSNEVKKANIQGNSGTAETEAFASTESNPGENVSGLSLKRSRNQPRQRNCHNFNCRTSKDVLQNKLTVLADRLNTLKSILSAEVPRMHKGYLAQTADEDTSTDSTVEVMTEGDFQRRVAVLASKLTADNSIQVDAEERSRLSREYLEKLRGEKQHHLNTEQTNREVLAVTSAAANTTVHTSDSSEQITDVSHIESNEANIAERHAPIVPIQIQTGLLDIDDMTTDISNELDLGSTLVTVDSNGHQLTNAEIYEGINVSTLKSGNSQDALQRTTGIHHVSKEDSVEGITTSSVSAESVSMQSLDASKESSRGLNVRNKFTHAEAAASADTRAKENLSVVKSETSSEMSHKKKKHFHIRNSTEKHIGLGTAAASTQVDSASVQSSERSRMTNKELNAHSELTLAETRQHAITSSEAHPKENVSSQALELLQDTREQVRHISAQKNTQQLEDSNPTTSVVESIDASEEISNDLIAAKKSEGTTAEAQAIESSQAYQEDDTWMLQSQKSHEISREESNHYTNREEASKLQTAVSSSTTANANLIHSLATTETDSSLLQSLEMSKGRKELGIMDNLHRFKGKPHLVSSESLEDVSNSESNISRETSRRTEKHRTIKTDVNSEATASAEMGISLASLQDQRRQISDELDTGSKLTHTGTATYAIASTELQEDTSLSESKTSHEVSQEHNARHTMETDIESQIIASAGTNIDLSHSAHASTEIDKQLIVGSKLRRNEAKSHAITSTELQIEEDVSSLKSVVPYSHETKSHHSSTEKGVISHARADAIKVDTGIVQSADATREFSQELNVGSTTLTHENVKSHTTGSVQVEHRDVPDSESSGISLTSDDGDTKLHATAIASTEADVSSTFSSDVAGGTREELGTQGQLARASSGTMATISTEVEREKDVSSVKLDVSQENLAERKRHYGTTDVDVDLQEIDVTSSKEDTSFIGKGDVIKQTRHELDTIKGLTDPETDVVGSVEMQRENDVSGQMAESPDNISHVRKYHSVGAEKSTEVETLATDFAEADTDLSHSLDPTKEISNELHTQRTLSNIAKTNAITSSGSLDVEDTSSLKSESYNHHMSQGKTAKVKVATSAKVGDFVGSISASEEVSKGVDIASQLASVVTVADTVGASQLDVHDTHKEHTAGDPTNLNPSLLYRRKYKHTPPVKLSLEDDQLEENERTFARIESSRPLHLGDPRNSDDAWDFARDQIESLANIPALSNSRTHFSDETSRAIDTTTTVSPQGDTTAALIFQQENVGRSVEDFSFLKDARFAASRNAAELRENNIEVGLESSGFHTSKASRENHVMNTINRKKMDASAIKATSINSVETVDDSNGVDVQSDETVQISDPTTDATRARSEEILLYDTSIADASEIDTIASSSATASSTIDRELEEVYGTSQERSSKTGATLADRTQNLNTVRVTSTELDPGVVDAALESFIEHDYEEQRTSREHKFISSEKSSKPRIESNEKRSNEYGVHFSREHISQKVDDANKFLSQTLENTAVGAANVEATTQINGIHRKAYNSESGLLADVQVSKEKALHELESNEIGILSGTVEDSSLNLSRSTLTDNQSGHLVKEFEDVTREVSDEVESDSSAAVTSAYTVSPSLREAGISMEAGGRTVSTEIGAHHRESHDSSSEQMVGKSVWSSEIADASASADAITQVAEESVQTEEITDRHKSHTTSVETDLDVSASQITARGEEKRHSLAEEVETSNGRFLDGSRSSEIAAIDIGSAHSESSASVEAVAQPESSLTEENWASEDISKERNEVDSSTQIQIESTDPINPYPDDGVSNEGIRPISPHSTMADSSDESNKHPSKYLPWYKPTVSPTTAETSVVQRALAEESETDDMPNAQKLALVPTKKGILLLPLTVEASAAADASNAPELGPVSTQTVEAIEHPHSSTFIQPFDYPKTDIYIVRTPTRGPVRITHMKDGIPPLVSFRLIPKEVYEQVRNVIGQHQISYNSYPVGAAPVHL